VLVDGPELHQNERDAGAFAGAVTQLGEDNQLVFATGWASVADALPEAVVIRLE